jgi:hypothetical protein
MSSKRNYEDSHAHLIWIYSHLTRLYGQWEFCPIQPFLTTRYRTGFFYQGLYDLMHKWDGDNMASIWTFSLFFKEKFLIHISIEAIFKIWTDFRHMHLLCVILLLMFGLSLFEKSRRLRCSQKVLTVYSNTNKV